MSVKRKLWSRAADGKAIFKYTITNSKGASVVLSNIGAGIISINVPDRNISFVILSSNIGHITWF